MRDYGKVAPFFWTRGSGKKLRGDPDAQIVALYLFTCPASNMIGVFYLPIFQVAHETGLTTERVAAAFARLSKPDVAIAYYDPDEEMVWLPNMAGFQIGDTLDPNDKKRSGPVRAEIKKLGGHRFVADFWSKYGEAYSLGPCPVRGLNRNERSVNPAQSGSFQSNPPHHQSGDATPARDPVSAIDRNDRSPIPDDRSTIPQEQEQEQEQEQDDPPANAGGPQATDPDAEPREPSGPTRASQPPPTPPSPLDLADTPKSKRGTRLAPEWRPSPDTVARLRTKHRVDPLGSLDRFQNHWLAKTGKDATKLDWDRTFANWVENDVSYGKLPRIPIEDDLPLIRLPGREAWIPEPDKAPDYTGVSFRRGQ
jgi:hypothetical protein